MIGNIGDVVFEVSVDAIRTFQSFDRSGKAKFARHDVIGRKPLLQYTGSDLQSISVTIQLRAENGVNPSEELTTLRDMKDAADFHPTFIGDEYMGNYVIEDIKETYSRVDNKGVLLAADVSLSLLEHVGWGNE